MKRRTFLATVGAAALWPSLVRRAFADASFDAPGAKKTVPGYESARARAQQAKKPLFVIVVPADDGKKYERGELWGEFLNHAPAEMMAPLATVEVTCATKAELGGLARDIAGEPLAIVVQPDGSARAVDAKYQTYHPGLGRRADWNNDDKISDARIAAVGNMVASALPAALLPKRDVAALGQKAIRELRDAPPSGSHWARASSCGPATVEDMKDDDAVGYGCGMGHVPAKASRFLYFFAKSPQQMERDWIAAQEKKPKK